MRGTKALCGLLLMFTGVLTGCGFFVAQTSIGGTTTTAASGDYLYIGNGNNANIAGFDVSTVGALSVLSNSPYNNAVSALSLAVNPVNNAFLYAGTANGIYVYGISSNGSISVLNNGTAVAQDVIPTFMQVDSTGTYLLATGIGTSLDAQAISIYTIDNSTGLLTLVPNFPLELYTGAATTPIVVKPTGLLITPNNAYVYVSLGTLGVQVLTLGTGGALSAGNAPTFLPPISTSTSPSDLGLASDPNSLFLFVAETNTGLRVLTIGTGGALSEITGSPFTVGTGPIAVTLDSTGSYVYVANKGSNSISAFTLTAASGKLTPVSGSPFSSGGQIPLGFANDNQKKYLAVINSGGASDLQLFSFDATIDGKLDPVSSATTGTDPTNPQSIAATH